MTREAMYREKAKYYDLIYTTKNYSAESNDVLMTIKKYKRSNGKELLDVGCGTGNHLRYFKKRYHCTGVDINAGILAVAMKKHKDIKFFKQSMTSLRLQKKYDIITSLFSAIGYLRTENELKRAFVAFSKHLQKGGVLIIEPWMTKEVYKVGSTHMQTLNNPRIKICRANVSEVRGDLSVLKFHWLVAEQNKPITHFVDEHIARMTPIKDLVRFSTKAGLKTTFIKSKAFRRGLLVGVKT